MLRGAARGGAAQRGAQPGGLVTAEQLTRIRAIILEQLDRSCIALSEVLPALRERGVDVTDWDKLDAETKERANRYFRSTVFPVLTPLAVDPAHPFPFLSNHSLSLQARYDAQGDVQDLKDAIDAAEAAVTTTPPDHPDPDHPDKDNER